jgi:hypothetical protein
MRIPGKRLLMIGSAFVFTLGAAAGGVWLLLTHQPRFYRAMAHLPRAQLEQRAKHFSAQSLQLYNDIRNEPTWEAIFTDQEVNAWLAEDLVTEFADQLPPEVHEPRVLFELDRVTLAFELDQGPIKSIVWVVARPRVPQPNVLELTLEKIRAGVLPVPADHVIDRIIEHAREQDIKIERKVVDGLPVVVVRYTPHSQREDVLLEQVQIREGILRLAGRSNRAKGFVSAPTLPSRKVLQSKFPRRKTQGAGTSLGPSSTTLRSSASPTS